MAEPRVYVRNTSDPEQVARSKAAQDYRAQELVNWCIGVMNHSDGRALMYDILAFCGTGRTPFVEGKPDLTSFNCGAQNVGHWLRVLLEGNAPTQFALMLEERRRFEELLLTMATKPTRAPQQGPTEGTETENPDE